MGMRDDKFRKILGIQNSMKDVLALQQTLPVNAVLRLSGKPKDHPVRELHWRFQIGYEIEAVVKIGMN